MHIHVDHTEHIQMIELTTVTRNSNLFLSQLLQQLSSLSPAFSVPSSRLPSSAVQAQPWPRLLSVSWPPSVLSWLPPAETLPKTLSFSWLHDVIPVVFCRI